MFSNINSDGYFLPRSQTWNWMPFFIYIFISYQKGSAFWIIQDAVAIWNITADIYIYIYIYGCMVYTALKMVNSTIQSHIFKYSPSMNTILDNIILNIISTAMTKVKQRSYYELTIHRPKKVLGHLWLPLLHLLLWWFSSEALSMSPCVLINEVSFVGKSMSHIINFNNLQWVQKYLIICTHSRFNWLQRNKLVKKLVFFMLTCDSFKM